MQHRCLLALATLALCLPGCGGTVQPTDSGTDAQTLDATAVLDSGEPDAGLEPDAGPPEPPWVDPPYSGPTAEIEVLRDNLGIPHIYGATDTDVFFGAGYTQAVDRLFQMDYLRRRALGRASEVVGARRLNDDKLIRAMNIPRLGRLTAERTRAENPEDFALVLAWVNGVNRRVDEVLAGRAPTPPEYTQTETVPERWTTVDALTVARLLTYRNANQLEFDFLGSAIRDFLPDAYAALPVIGPMSDAFVLPAGERPARTTTAAEVPSIRARPTPFPPGAAEALRAWTDTFEGLRRGNSNNWAVGAQASFNGRPLLAGDPHQPLSTPSVFWAHHMNSAARGGTLDVIGFGFAGSPGVQLGHTARVGWTATTTYPDWMDLTAVRVTNGNVTIRGQSIRVTRRMERIDVKGRATPELLVVEEVPGYGPFVPDGVLPLSLPSAAGKKLLFQWTGFRATSDSEAFFAFNRAQSLAQWQTAVDRMETGAFNFIGADASGIAYRVNMLIPDRGPLGTSRPYLTMDEREPAAFWTGQLLDAARLPRSSGGTQGYLCSANNDPYGFLAGDRIDDDPFYYGVWFDPGIRAHRIDQRLNALVQRGNVTIEEMEQLQLDTHSVYADELLPVLFEVYGRLETDPALADFRGDADLAALYARLMAWDRRMDRASADALVFEYFIQLLSNNVLGDDLALVYEAVSEGDPPTMLKFVVRTVQRDLPNSDALMAEGRDRLVLQSLREAATQIRVRFGGLEASRYAWRDIHGTRFPSILGDALPDTWVPTNGGIGTVNVSNTLFADIEGPRRRLESTDGAIYRMVLSFAADGTPEARVNFPRGNSGDPTSPFFSDQLADWVEGVYKPLPFRRADVEANLHDRSTISR